MEMQQMRAVGRRSLGKYRHMLALAENPGDFLINDLGVTTTAPAQKDRIVPGRQPADQGPVTDFFLGDEGGRQHRVDDIDVDPGDMVGNQQCTRHDMRQIGLNLYPQRIEQGNGPTGFQPSPRGLAAYGKDGEHQWYRTGDQQSHAKQPEGANQEMGFVQSVCPG